MILLLLGCPPPEPPPEPPDPAPTLRVMAPGDAIVLDKGRFAGAVPVYSGPPVSVWEASGERVLLYTLTQSDPPDVTGGALYDTAGQQLATFPIPRTVSWDLGVATAWDRVPGIPSLVRLDDGATLTTELTLPDGEEATEVRLFLSEQVLVAARGASGEAAWGVFTGEGEPALSPLPLWPVDMSIDGERVEAWSARGIPGDEGDCVHYRLDGEARCRMVDAGATQDSWPLSGGYTAVSSWTSGVRLYRDSQPVPWRLEDDCRWTVSATWADPPRVLADCHPDRALPERRRRLWSPDWERQWVRDLPPSRRGSFVSRPARHPILAEPIPDTTPTLSEHWIDLTSGERWQSPLLTPLSYDELPRPGLGRDPHTGGVVLLDFDSGVYHTIENAGEDCPVELSELGREHGLVLLTCRSRPDPSRYQFIHHWSVVIDLEKRVAWKLDQLPEAILSPTALLVSDRVQTQAEGFVGTTALNRLLLE